MTTPPIPEGFVREVPEREEFATTSYGRDIADVDGWEHVPEWLQIKNQPGEIPHNRWSIVGVRAAVGTLLVLLALASAVVLRIVTNGPDVETIQSAAPEIKQADAAIQQRSRTELESFSQRFASLRLRPTTESTNEFLPIGINFALPADAVLSQTDYQSIDRSRMGADGGWNQAATVPVFDDSSTTSTVPRTTTTLSATTNAPNATTTALAPQNSLVEVPSTTIPSGTKPAPSTFAGETTITWLTAVAPSDAATTVFSSIVDRAVISDITSLDEQSLVVRTVLFAPLADGSGETELAISIGTQAPSLTTDTTTTDKPPKTRTPATQITVRRKHQLSPDTNPPMQGWALAWTRGLPTESGMRLVQVAVSSTTQDEEGAPLPKIAVTWLAPYESRGVVTTFVDSADFATLGFQKLAVDESIRNTTLSNRREFFLGTLPAYVDVFSDVNETSVGTKVDFVLETDCPLTVVNGDASAERELCR